MVRDEAVDQNLQLWFWTGLCCDGASSSDSHQKKNPNTLEEPTEKCFFLRNVGPTAAGRTRRTRSLQGLGEA